MFNVDSNHTVPNKPESNGILANNTNSVEVMGIEPTSLSLQGRNAEALEHASPY